MSSTSVSPSAEAARATGRGGPSIASSGRGGGWEQLKWPYRTKLAISDISWKYSLPILTVVLRLDRCIDVGQAEHLQHEQKAVGIEQELGKIVEFEDI